MLDKSFGLHFYFKRSKDNVKRIIPIYLRITVDSILKKVSTKRTYGPNRLNLAADATFGINENARALNAYFDTLHANTYEPKRQLIEINQMEIGKTFTK